MRQRRQEVGTLAVPGGPVAGGALSAGGPAASAAASGAAAFPLERSPVVGVLIVMVSAFRGVEVRFRSRSMPSEPTLRAIAATS